MEPGTLQELHVSHFVVVYTGSPGNPFVWAPEIQNRFRNHIPPEQELYMDILENETTARHQFTLDNFQVMHEGDELSCYAILLEKKEAFLDYLFGKYF